jgi:hypothetical protein
MGQVARRETAGPGTPVFRARAVFQQREHGWGPRASARGNLPVRGGNRLREGKRVLQRLLAPGFPPGLGRGLPFWGGSCCPLLAPHPPDSAPREARLRAALGEARVGPSRKREGKPASQGETLPLREHGWGPRASARGNPQAKGETLPLRGTGGALAQARGETRKPRGKRYHCGAQVGPSRKREGKPASQGETLPLRGTGGALAQARGETREREGNSLTRVRAVSCGAVETD